MKNELRYRGYTAKVEYDPESRVLYGKIEGIRDLVNFQSDSAKEIENEFHSAVDDYLAFCAEIGQQPDKVYAGSLNVRIPPEEHRRLSEIARRENISLNAVITEACRQYRGAQA